ncbi:MAG: hypothetical protein L0Y55_04915, partial [Anaerolineales bacterium]|nr:hypothetical protein [Anaerolineales bacterium]
MTTRRLLWGMTWRGAVWGTILGVVLGLLVGIFFLILGTIFLALAEPVQHTTSSIDDDYTVAIIMFILL